MRLAKKTNITFFSKLPFRDHFRFSFRDLLGTFRDFVFLHFFMFLYIFGDKKQNGGFWKLTMSILVMVNSLVLAPKSNFCANFPSFFLP